MSEELKYILSVIGALLIACFTAYLGYRSGIKCEKRKEFNELADPLRDTMRNLQENLTNPHVNPRWPREDEFDNLTDRVSFFHKKKLLKAIDAYKFSLKNSCEYGKGGNFRITDEENIRESINELLKCLRRK